MDTSSTPSQTLVMSNSIEKTSSTRLSSSSSSSSSSQARTAVVSPAYNFLDDDANNTPSAKQVKKNIFLTEEDDDDNASEAGEEEDDRDETTRLLYGLVKLESAYKKRVEAATANWGTNFVKLLSNIRSNIKVRMCTLVQSVFLFCS